MITRPITRPITSPIARRINDPSGVGLNFNALVAALFRNGEQGFAFDNNRLDTLYQDAAGTTPVTAAGQPVGLQLDISGRGNHRFQAAAASRPILRQNATTGAYYLEADGSDDWMQTNSIDFTGTDKVTLFTGLRKLSDEQASVIVEFSSNISTNQAFSLAAPSGAGAKNFWFSSRGTLQSAANSGAVYPAPITAVVCGFADIAVDTCILRVNSAQAAPSTSDQGTGTYGNYPVYFFRRAGTTLPFNGHEYGSICVGRLRSAAEITSVERLLAQRTGVQLA